mgnify:CR=1 FL=1
MMYHDETFLPSTTLSDASPIYDQYTFHELNITYIGRKGTSGGFLSVVKE